MKTVKLQFRRHRRSSCRDSITFHAFHPHFPSLTLCFGSTTCSKRYIQNAISDETSMVTSISSSTRCSLLMLTFAVITKFCHVAPRTVLISTQLLFWIKIYLGSYAICRCCIIRVCIYEYRYNI